MDKLFQAQQELHEMDELASEKSPVHFLHPLGKLLVTIFYIIIVVSFPKYDLSGLVVMVLYPVILFQIAEIPLSLCFYRFRMVLPLVCAVGLVNPFFDHTAVIELGNVVITGGMISMVTLMMKGVFSLMASFLLIATTPVDAICSALRILHVPEMITTLILLTYRYVGVMVDEVSVMTQAYQLRAPGQKGIHISAWGSFLGQLLLRSMDKAEELFHSMQLRGFHGEFYYVDKLEWSGTDVVYGLVCIAAFLCCRFIDIAGLLGSLFVR